MAAHDSAHIELPRRHHRLVAQALQRWQEKGLIDEQTALRLLDATVIAPFDWQRTARYAFIIAIVALVIAWGPY